MDSLALFIPDSCLSCLTRFFEVSPRYHFIHKTLADGYKIWRLVLNLIIPYCTLKIGKSKVKSLSRVQLLVTPRTVAYRTPPFMGFSRQEYGSGLPFLLQRIFPTQESSPGRPHCRQILYLKNRQLNNKSLISSDMLYIFRFLELFHKYMYSLFHFFILMRIKIRCTHENL